MSAVPKLRSDATTLPFDLTKIRREALRWLCLKTLCGDMRYCGTDLALLNIARSEYPDATLTEMRHELQYLLLAKLLTLTEKRSRWRLQLTQDGVDIAEYTIACPPAIGRPPPGAHQ